MTADVSDAAGNAAAQVTSSSFAVDTTAPTVSYVTGVENNGTFKASDLINITVRFSESVDVAGATPYIVLSVGADYNVDYSTGSGSQYLTFPYTVQSGHTSADLDYASTAALTLNGATIKDAAGNSATITLATPGASNSLSSAKNYVIDTTAPTITGTTIAANNSTIAVTFSEAVYDTDGGSGALEVGDFALSIAGGTATVAATPSSISISGNVYTLGLTLTGTPDGSETLTVVPSGATAIYDFGGNAASTTQSNNTIGLNDQAAPTMVISSTTVASGTTTNDATIAMKFTSSESTTTSHTDTTVSYTHLTLPTILLV